MSPTLNFISNNLQGYGPSETRSLPCLGVSGRAVSISSFPRSEFNSFQVKVVSLKRSVKQMSLVCRASSGSQRRNPDFQNRHVYSRSRNRFNGDRDSSENVDESEFLSTKKGPILSLSNSSKPHATAAPGPKEREIVELFRKVQTQLRERAAVKEEKKFEGVKGQKKESETVDSLLKLLKKHSAEQGKKKVNGVSSSEFSFDRPRQSGPSDEDKSRGFFSSDSIAKEDPHETIKPYPSRPVSSFRRRSPVPRVKYEPFVSAKDTYRSVSPSDLHDNTTETHAEIDLEYESESDSEPDMDITSGLEIEEEEQEEEHEDTPETELEPEVDETVASELSKVEALHAEEDDFDQKDNEKQHSEIKDLSVMKLTELRALAKARGMKGFSKLKKSELVGILSDDSIYP